MYTYKVLRRCLGLQIPQQWRPEGEQPTDTPDDERVGSPIDTLAHCGTDGDESDREQYRPSVKHHAQR